MLAMCCWLGTSAGVAVLGILRDVFSHHGPEVATKDELKAFLAAWVPY